MPFPPHDCKITIHICYSYFYSLPCYIYNFYPLDLFLYEVFGMDSALFFQMTRQVSQHLLLNNSSFSFQFEMPTLSHTKLPYISKNRLCIFYSLMYSCTITTVQSSLTYYSLISAMSST